MKYILALDQGTTSSRAIVFDQQGSIRTLAQQEFRQIYPASGWVEHDPQEIYESQLRVAREALDREGLTPKEIAALGITNQRETTLVWDRRTGEPVSNAIVWQDRRTASYCDRLREAGHAGLIAERTGLVIDAYFSGTKVAWILDNVPGLRERARSGELAFGTVDTWLIWKLTGGRVFVTDVSNASRTLLFNIHTCEWDQQMLDLLDVPREVLPEVRDSSEVYGECEALGGIPIAGIAGDQQAALFGQGCFRTGLGKNTYGTGCFLLMNTGEQPVVSRNRLLTTVAWRRAGRTHYALEGSIFIAGAVVQWLRDGLGLIQSAEQIEALAGQVPDTGGVYLIPAFAGLGAPYWDPYARGIITGITRGTTSAHFARAALESIAFQVAEVVEAMRADSGLPLQELRVDGGASRNNLLMQFQADLLGVPVVRPTMTETTALGAAYLAGLAVGYWKDEREIEANWQIDRTFEPSAEHTQVQSRLGKWRRAVERSRGWIAS